MCFIKNPAELIVTTSPDCSCTECVFKFTLSKLLLQDKVASLLWYTWNWRHFRRGEAVFVCRIKGGRDLCVKLGLNTPGEEGRTAAKSTAGVWCGFLTDARMYPRVSTNAGRGCVWVTLIQNVTGGMFQVFQRSILTPYQKAEQTQYTSELPLSTSVYQSLPGC